MWIGCISVIPCKVQEIFVLLQGGKGDRIQCTFPCSIEAALQNQILNLYAAQTVGPLIKIQEKTSNSV